jgi:hypothetical protein
MRNFQFGIEARSLRHRCANAAQSLRNHFISTL